MNHRTCDFCLMDMFEGEKPSECYEETHVLIHGLRSRIAALEKERRWIPASNPPEIGQTVLVYAKKVIGNDGEMTIYSAKFNRFKEFSMPGIGGIEVAHWQPLPQPPEGREG